MAGLRPAYSAFSDQLSLFLHAPLFGRTTTIVRDRCDVLDGPHFDAGGRKRAHRRFPAGTRTGHSNLVRPQAALRRLVGGGEGGLLRGKWRPLARPAES